MPIVVDPETALPDKTKGVKPSQLILWLLFPVIFAVGFTVGLVVGIKQGQNSVTGNASNRLTNQSTVIPNSNTRIVNETKNANTNVSNAFANITNTTFGSGDYLKLSANAKTQILADRQQALDHSIDTTVSVDDQVRQQDLYNIKFDLKEYFTVEQAYPSTSGIEIKVEVATDNILNEKMKEFYGGQYYLRIDPKSPTNYYAYKSDGSSFTLSAYLVSTKKPFTLTEK